LLHFSEVRFTGLALHTTPSPDVITSISSEIIGVWPQRAELRVPCSWTTRSATIKQACNRRPNQRILAL